MPMQTYALDTPRIGKFKGQILQHAVPLEVLGAMGRQIQMPKNASDTIVFRQWLPYGATSTNANTRNQFFQNGTGDRAAAIIQAHQISEGVTPAPDSITPFDTTVVLQEYGCLYGLTNKTADLYEDDVPQAMLEQIGERVTFVNEMIIYGALKACTNVFYGGTGTSVATVNGAITLNLVRKVVKGLQANHAKPVNRILSASPDFGTSAVEGGYTVVCHSDLEPDLRDLPNFVPTSQYASGQPMKNEIGMCERFRFLTSPDLPSIQDGGAAIATYPGFQSTSGTSMDVYPFIVTAQDAWGQVALRGRQSLDPTYIPPGTKDKADPLGQRGYAGTTWWKAVVIENQGWMAVANVAIKTL